MGSADEDKMKVCSEMLNCLILFNVSSRLAIASTPDVVFWVRMNVLTEAISGH